MTPEELRQCIEDAFGNLEPPNFEDLGAFYEYENFLDVVRTDTAQTKRWQELRPLTQYLHGALDVFCLHTDSFRYYLPAFLYAMTDPEIVCQYLSPILDRLWYEDGWGEPYPPAHRDTWMLFEATLTVPQKRCIANFLTELLKTIDASEELNEVTIEGDRIENMLNKYWKAWL